MTDNTSTKKGGKNMEGNVEDRRESCNSQEQAKREKKKEIKNNSHNHQIKLASQCNQKFHVL
jgi:hypothetical protein